MKRLLLVVSIAVGMSTGVALAQHENMAGHENMPAADKAKNSAANQGVASSKMTPELKKDMADMYQKMADCLRTDKTMEQCGHDAMMNCPVVAKTGHCPINEGMGSMMGKGMKHQMGGMGNMKGKM